MKMGIERVLKEKFADALKDIQQVFDEENRETTVEVLKGPNAPFLMSGCKIADGVGTMLVTSVGSNTGWGLLMASISEDTGEEAPLQVHLIGLATFIGIIGLSVAALVLIILLIKYSARLEFDADKTSFLKAVYGGVKIFTIAGHHKEPVGCNPVTASLSAYFA